MDNRFSRTGLLLGTDKLDKLTSAHVAIFGVGGVGGYVAEALARSGVGTLDIIDKDVVDITNVNRQIIATTSTIGMPKVKALEERILDINPAARVNTYSCFYLPDNSKDFDFNTYDYIVDAVDTVTAKIELIVNANNTHTPIISSMGAGNKLDPTAFEVADIYKTSVCPLAKVMRRELKKRNIPSLKVVYSKEEPIKNGVYENGKATPGSIAFVPSVVGLIIASEVIKDIIK